MAIGEFKRELGDDRVLTGEFGADMDVQLVNWGPVTLSLDSANKSETYFEDGVGDGGKKALGEKVGALAADVVVKTEWLEKL